MEEALLGKETSINIEENILEKADSQEKYMTNQKNNNIKVITLQGALRNLNCNLRS